MYNHAVRAQALVMLLFAAACAPQAATATQPTRELRPYLTVTPSATAPTAPNVVGAAETALPSPTPFTYRIAAGDTLSQIAEKYGVSLDALIAANPGVDPNAMSVGGTLKIPSGQQTVTGEATPTPVPLPVEQVACHPVSDGGAWCFALVHNNSANVVENVTARFGLIDSNGQSIGDQAALLPLDIVAPGQLLPLSAYFPPNVPIDARPQVLLLTAVSLLPGDQRYLEAQISNTLVTVDWSGLNADARGIVTLASNSKPAALVWVAAVAYDAAGNVIGVRRWENSAGVGPGGNLPFTFLISSVAGRIERVDFAVEARPK